MFQNNSPLEYLLAFTATFVAGALTTVGLAKYSEYLKKKYTQEPKKE